MSPLNSVSPGAAPKGSQWVGPLRGSSRGLLEQHRQVLTREDLGTSCSFTFAEQRPMWMRESVLIRS